MWLLVLLVIVPSTTRLRSSSWRFWAASTSGKLLQRFVVMAFISLVVKILKRAVEEMIWLIFS